jgi:hypothetical protein
VGILLCHVIEVKNNPSMCDAIFVNAVKWSVKFGQSRSAFFSSANVTTRDYPMGLPNGDRRSKNERKLVTIFNEGLLFILVTPFP